MMDYEKTVISDEEYCVPVVTEGTATPILANIYSGPEIAVTVTPQYWTNQSVVVSAEYTDAESEIVAKQWSNDGVNWFDYLQPMTIAGNVWLYFRAINAENQETIERKHVKNIDRIAPIISVTVLNYTVLDATVRVDYNDYQSEIAERKYSLDGGSTWYEYTGHLTVAMGGEVTFWTIDHAGNETQVIYTVEQPTECAEIIAKSDESFDENYCGIKKIDIAKGVVVSGACWRTYEKTASLKMADNAELYAQEITEAIAGKISASLKNNTILKVSGNLGGISKLTTGSNCTVSVGGILSGTNSNDNIAFNKNAVVRLGGVELGIGKNALTFNSNFNVQISGGVNGVSKFSAGNGSSRGQTIWHANMGISGGISGSVNNDNFTFGNFTSVAIDGAIRTYSGNDTIKIGKFAIFHGGEIDLGSAGKNTLSIGDLAEVMVDGISNANKISVANGSAKNTGKGIPERYSELFVGGGVTGTIINDTFNFGNYNKVTIVGDINTDSGNDTIKLGKYSQLSAGNVNFNSTGKNTLSLGTCASAAIGAIANVNKVTVANGSSGNTGAAAAPKYSELIVDGPVGGTFIADEYTFGNFNKVTIAGDINTGSGNDTLKLGNFSELVAGRINFGDIGKNTLSIGSCGSASFDGVCNVNKFTVANGSAGNSSHAADPKYCEVFIAGDVIGTIGNDNYTFGNYNRVAIAGALEMGSGNDVIKLGKFSELSASDVNFDPMWKNSFEVGSCASAFVGAINNVSKLNVANGSAGNKSKYIADRYSVLVASGGISGTFNADTFNFGNYAEVVVSGTIDTGLGNDTIKIGSKGVLRADYVNFELGKNTLSAGGVATVDINSISGLNKFTLAAGKSSSGHHEYSEFYCADFKGTDADDSITLGNYSYSVIGDVDLKLGLKDKLTVGNYSVIEVTGRITNVETFSFGKESVLRVDSGAKIYGTVTGVNGTNMIDFAVGGWIDEVDLGSDKKDVINICDLGSELSGDADLIGVCKNVNNWEICGTLVYGFGEEFAVEIDDLRRAWLENSDGAISVHWVEKEDRPVVDAITLA